MPEKVYTTPRIDKLGIRPGARVVLVGVTDKEFERELHERTDAVVSDATEAADVVVYRADSPADLARLREMRGWIKPNGAVWVLRRKGKGAPVGELELMRAGQEAGMVDNKIASFSDELSAMRFVIRLRDRE